MQASDVVGIEYVCEILAVKVESARKLCRTNQVPGAFRVEKSWRIHKPTFDQHIKNKIESSLEKHAHKHAPVVELASVETGVKLPIEARYAALLGPKFMKKHYGI